MNFYNYIVFDCDGVILNSNPVKSDAFWHVASRYGEETAAIFLDYHKRNGGVSRYVKFRYLIEVILGRSVTENELNSLLTEYSNYTCEHLLQCDIVSGLHDLKNSTEGIGWAIASGGDQNELRSLFKARGLAELFELGIYGSPTPKTEILKRLRDSVASSGSKMLMVGDSVYDFEAAKLSGYDFIFAAYWTEVSNPNEFCSKNSVRTINSLADICA